MLNRIKKIRNKLLFISMLTSFIGLFVLTTVIVLIAINMIEEKREQRIESQITMLATNLTAPVLFEDSVTTNDILRSINVDTEIIAATVSSKTGTFIVDFVNEKVFFNYSAQANSRNYRDPKNTNTRTYKVGIIDNGDLLGQLTLYVSNINLDNEISRILYTSSGIFLLTLLLVYVLSTKLQKTITRSIERLSQISKKISDTRDYSIRVLINSNDEVGLLAQEFNGMLEQIEQRDLMLESKVQHRTSELERLAEEFRHRAFHDSLTGLPNRALLYEKFPAAIAHAKRKKCKIALILIDLDNFKTINDTLGHDFGDELLKVFSKRFTQHLRAEDIVCRLGGDEFIVLAEELSSLDDILKIGNGLFAILNRNIIVKGKKLDVGMSIGGALYPDHGNDITKIKRAADIAMYYSKDAGKNQYHTFRADMEESAIQRLIVQNDLKSAIQEKQIELYYQPKINAQTEKTQGCEVLIRWQHPHYGLLFPDSFIPYAEEAGHIKMIDYYVLDQAFQQAQTWKEEGHTLTVAINLSGSHFQNREIAIKLSSLLVEYNVNPEHIEIELTEAVLISDPDIALKVVREIKTLGIHIALDDFGTGYSSLGYLRTFPVDIIKLDKSFIANLLHNKQDKRITKGIISLAKGLELDVVAEGVETQEQAAYLKHIGCQYLQGYYYLKPASRSVFETWFKEHER